MNIKNKLISDTTIGELIEALMEIFPTKGELVATTDGLRGDLRKEVRDGFARIDKRFDNLELDHGQRLAKVEGRVVTLKKTIEEDLGAKVAWQ